LNRLAAEEERLGVLHELLGVEREPDESVLEAHVEIDLGAVLVLHCAGMAEPSMPSGRTHHIDRDTTERGDGEVAVGRSDEHVDVARVAGMGGFVVERSCRASLDHDAVDACVVEGADSVGRSRIGAECCLGLSERKRPTSLDPRLVIAHNEAGRDRRVETDGNALAFDDLQETVG
jgi:hypothetical protein